MSDQMELIPFGGGARSEKKRRGRPAGAKNKTAKARGDLLKYAEEVLGGKAAGQQLADLVTFTPKERAMARRFAKEQLPPDVFKLLTIDEMCFRFKVWKWEHLFQIPSGAAANLVLKLHGELMGYQHSRQAAVEAPKESDRDQIAPMAVDAEFMANIPQNQGDSLSADDVLAQGGSHNS